MDSRNQEIERLITKGATSLLARAADNRSIEPGLLASRIRSAVDKYLLRDNPNTTASEIEDFMGGMQADDLCLILACEQNNEKAWSELVERFTPTVRSAARSASSNEDAAEDLAQSIWAELHGLRSRKDGRPGGKLSYYSGRGSLAGWLRAVVSQLAVDVHRKQSRLVQAEEDSDLDRMAREVPAGEGQATLAAGLRNPEEVIANRFAESDMSDALSNAMQELSAEDRMLVKLYYFDGLRLKEAGAVLGVHEATASRRLTRIHGDLKKRVSQILIDDRGWTKAETERSFAEVAQNLGTDLEALVTKEGVS